MGPSSAAARASAAVAAVASFGLLQICYTALAGLTSCSTVSCTSDLGHFGFIQLQPSNRHSAAAASQHMVVADASEHPTEAPMQSTIVPSPQLATARSQQAG